MPRRFCRSFPDRIFLRDSFVCEFKHVVRIAVAGFRGYHSTWIESKKLDSGPVFLITVQTS